MDQFVDIILHWQNLMVVTVVGGALELLKKLAPKLTQNAHYRRWQRLIPLGACSALVWLPGVQTELEAGPRILLGLISGMFTLTLYDIIKKVLFRDQTIESRAKTMGQELKAHYVRKTPK